MEEESSILILSIAINDAQIERESPITPDAQFEGESHSKQNQNNKIQINDSLSDAGTVMEEIVSEVLPEVDPTYPQMTKWIKDHPKTQII